MNKLSDTLHFKSGATLSNRFVLAPLTNLQSHTDGTLSEQEFRWLTMRAEGGFGMVMTCATQVQPAGQGFVGQLGCFDDRHIEGLTRLAAAIKAQGSLAVMQLHHAGMRSPSEVTGQAPQAPSDHAETGARGISHAEVITLREAFITAALRAERAGFDGVELHAAHGYMLAEFLSPTINRRSDEYGGSLDNRSRLLREIIDAVRSQCRKDFIIGVRLSPERYDIELLEMQALAQQLCTEGRVDFIDLSLWDVFKEPADKAFKGRSLLSYFTEIDRGEVLLGVAGKLYSAKDCQRCLELGADFVMPGRAAILHHDFPRQVAANPDFTAVALPVSVAYLQQQGVGKAFIDYLSGWQGFVASE